MGCASKELKEEVQVKDRNLEPRESKYRWGFNHETAWHQPESKPWQERSRAGTWKITIYRSLGKHKEPKGRGQRVARVQSPGSQKKQVFQTGGIHQPPKSASDCVIHWTRQEGDFTVGLGYTDVTRNLTVRVSMVLGCELDWSRSEEE